MILTKREIYLTRMNGEFSIRIGEFQGKFILSTKDNIILDKDELEDLINVLKDFYERMD
jgi:hypothetical protein